MVMPPGWETVELGKYANVARGGSPRPIQAYLTTRRDGINWIKIGDVAPSAKYITSTEERIIPEGSLHSRVVKEGDFILSNSMSFGRPYILKIAGCIHDGWLTIQNYQEAFDTDYLYYILGSESTIKQYEAMAAGSSVHNLSKEKVESVILCKPPLPEQRAIAAALSDADSWIAALDELIAKKRAIKQGAMQELLTGKQRLPGFSGKWVEKGMLDYLKFEVGFPFNSDLFNQKHEGIRLVKNRDLKSDDQVYFTTEDYDTAYLVRNGDVLIGMDGDFIPCLWNKGLALLNQRVGRIKPINFDLVFAYYILRKPLEQLQTGTGATTVKHLLNTNLESVRIYAPLDIAEQSAIAIVLSDMDAEIDTLVAKRDKAKLIKQGMMQELLTGNIRLIQSIKATQKTRPHNQQFDDAIMIAGIVNSIYSDRFPLGRKKVQKCLYLLRRHQDESTEAFQKKAAGP
jgi:type I restriction enzyme S subunit